MGNTTYLEKKANCMHKITKTEKETTSTKITNFVLVIIKEIVRIFYNGKQEIFFLIKGRNERKEPLEAIVSAAEFNSLNWITTKFGGSAFILKGGCTHDIRVFILEKSQNRAYETHYGFIGYTGVDGELAYLHAGGSITSSGPDNSIYVDLPTHLKSYNLLPAPTNENSTIKLIRLALDLPKIAPKKYEIGLALLASFINAVFSLIMKERLSLLLSGATGSFKTSICLIIQAFFGSGFIQKGPPAGFESTAAGIEEMTKLARNAILLVDESTYKGHKQQDDDMEKAAERLFRGSANQTARARYGEDSKPPEAIILATGEDVPNPRAKSLIKRIMIILLSKNDVDLKCLTEYQKIAGNGDFSRLTSHFIQWILKTRDRLERYQSKLMQQYLVKARHELNGHHARTIENAAVMATCLELFYRYARVHKAITLDQFNSYNVTAWTYAVRIAQQQTRYEKQRSVSQIVLNSVKHGLSDGKVHLLDPQTNKCPSMTNKKQIGWKNGKPQGKFLGWLDSKRNRVLIASETDIQIIADLVPGAHQNLLSSILGPKLLWKSLKDDGAIIVTLGGRNTVLVGKINGKDRRAYHLNINIDTE